MSGAVVVQKKESILKEMHIKRKMRCESGNALGASIEGVTLRPILPVYRSLKAASVVSQRDDPAISPA